MATDNLNRKVFELWQKGRSREALPIAQEVLKTRLELLGSDDPLTALSCLNLGAQFQALADYVEAQRLYQKALEIHRRVLGEDHPATATSYNNVAYNLKALGKAAEAAPLYQKALDICRKVLGEDHPATATSYNNVAANLNAQGKAAEAQPLFQKALDICRKVLGEDHPDTARSYNRVAYNLQAQGKAAEAQPLFQKALDICRKVLGEDHPDTARSYNRVAYNLQAQGKAAEAQPLYQKALDISRRVLGEDHPDTAQSYNNVAGNLYAQGKAAEAQPLFRMALDIRLKVLGEDHPATATSYNNVAFNLDAQGKAAEAAAILRQAIFSYEGSRLNRAKGIERAIGGGFNPRLLLAAIEQTKAPPEAWSQVELSLSRGLLDQQGQDNTLLTAQEVAELTPLQDRVTDFQSQILVMVSKAKRTADENSQLEQLLQDRREAGQKLAELAVAASTRSVASREQIQSAIPAQSALLLWVDMTDNSGKVQVHFACVVRREGEPFWIRLPGSGEQGKWTKEDDQFPGLVRAGLAQSVPPTNLPELIQQFRQQRIEPVLAYLQEDQIKQLYVVGVYQIAGIPVEVLAPEFTISYVPSGTFLARLPKKPTFENTLLAVGDPIYEVEKSKPLALTALPPHGLYIQQLAPKGAAEKMGLQPGDVLLTYDGTDIKSIDDLRPAIQKAVEAKLAQVEVSYWRVDDQNTASTKTVKLPLGPLGVILHQDPAPVAIANRRQSEELFAKLSRGDGFTDLPGTRYEVTRLRQLFSSSQVLLDSQASERSLDALRRSGELGTFRYLHFATHGKANNVQAFESKLVLSQDQPKELLAKPGEPWFNNEVSAREVLDYWKLNADLVTLSACETAIGRQGGGDGLLGFAQAFLLAGSRSVCLSLWEVDDTATALLMQRFYQNLLGKREGLTTPMPKAKALEEAKQWLRGLSAADATTLTAQLTEGISRGTRGEKKVVKSDIPLSVKPDDKPYAHPHYWSAFILLGEAE